MSDTRLWSNERLTRYVATHRDEINANPEQGMARLFGEMRADYEQRIAALERQLAEAQANLDPEALTAAYLLGAGRTRRAQRGQWQPRVMSRSWDGTESGNYTTAPAAPITQEALREAGWSTFSSAGGVVMEYPPHIHNDDPQLGLHAWWYPDGGMMLSLRSFHNLHPVNHIRTMTDLSTLIELLTGTTPEPDAEGGDDEAE